VLKVLELDQSSLKRRQPRQRGFHGWGDLVEELPWPKRVEQRDVRHPTAELAVVALADGLDRRPDVLRRDDDGGRVVRALI
jgi:hypothetical protein